MHWQVGHPACKKYFHNSVPGSPWQHSGSMLSASQEHCYCQRRDAAEVGEQGSSHNHHSVPDLCWQHGASVLFPVILQCFDALGWATGRACKSTSLQNPLAAFFFNSHRSLWAIYENAPIDLINLWKRMVNAVAEGTTQQISINLKAKIIVQLKL